MLSNPEDLLILQRKLILLRSRARWGRREVVRGRTVGMRRLTIVRIMDMGPRIDWVHW